jgi:hypothetical protein
LLATRDLKGLIQVKEFFQPIDKDFRELYKIFEDFSLDKFLYGDCSAYLNVQQPPELVKGLTEEQFQKYYELKMKRINMRQQESKEDPQCETEDEFSEGETSDVRKFVLTLVKDL